MSDFTLRICQYEDFEIQPDVMLICEAVIGEICPLLTKIKHATFEYNGDAWHTYEEDIIKLSARFFNILFDLQVFYYKDSWKIYVLNEHVQFAYQIPAYQQFDMKKTVYRNGKK